MPDEAHDSLPRSRQACEPCREKKIKCPAERPTCSTCARLNQPCIYRVRVTRASTGVTKVAKKTNSLRDRFQNLESTVNNLYTLLQSTPPDRGDTSPSTHQPECVEPEGPSPVLSDPNNKRVAGNRHPGQIEPKNTGPNAYSYLLDDAVGLYLETVHLQPLLLFRASDLLEHLKASSRHLACSFLSLVVYIRPLNTPLPVLSSAAQRCMHSAEVELRELASNGEARIDIVQSLCLLALRDIFACKPQRAQMTIATASHLESCRSAINRNLAISQDDDSIRCRWTVYILENIFSPQLRSGEADIPEPPFPGSAAILATLVSLGRQDYPSDLYNPYSIQTNHGILAYHIRMLSNWSHISEWLHQTRLGHVEPTWKPESRYGKLTARIYECDSQLPSDHLLRNVDFSSRSASDIEQAREYWIPWILMQIECHAFLSILCHPFIHLMAVPGCSKAPTSGLFLQHTIDSALFHSSWVMHFLRECEAHQLKLHDPFVGHLVAAVGTIFWPLQFVQDTKVSEKAIRDVNSCKEFLIKLSDTWPHLRGKVEIFEALQEIAERHRRDQTALAGVIAFPPTLLWELLITDKFGETRYRTNTPSAQTRIQITTHLTHPLTKEHPSPPPTQPEFGIDGAFVDSSRGSEQFHVDDLMGQFMIYNQY